MFAGAVQDGSCVSDKVQQRTVRLPPYCMQSLLTGTVEVTTLLHAEPADWYSRGYHPTACRAC